jgi:hypothetical protein
VLKLISEMCAKSEIRGLMISSSYRYSRVSFKIASTGRIELDVSMRM